MAENIKSPSEYASLPAGTQVYWAIKGGSLETAKLLQSVVSIGSMGTKANYIETTRLIDKEPKYLADMKESEEKTFVFIDDPDDENQEALLNASEDNQTAVFYTIYPNRRMATQELVLAGFSMQAVDSPKGKVLQVEVYGRQNSLKWSRQPAPQPAKKQG